MWAVRVAMKTNTNQTTISSSTIPAILVVAACAAVNLATGIPLMFGLCAAVSALTLSFGASAFVAAMVEHRGPVSLIARRGGVTLVAATRPISRPARVAA